VARNMYIELTGTGGSNTNLVVPANKKLYFIYNNSTGAVTVKVSGQTGVSVPTGKKMVLVSNGTDIVNGINYIADLGTNSFTVTNLTASSATITNLIATSGSITNLVSSDASATVLRAGSATLTHLSATSASITNLTLTSLVISNLSIASANITTLTSTSATITNLLATSLAVSSIATFAAGSAAAPSITTVGDTNTGIFFPAADTIAFTEGGTESLRISSAGNVGIGTTNPSYPLMIFRRAGSTITDPLLNLQSQTSGLDGDSFVLFGTQTQNWAAGVDQADSNKFRIEPSTTLGGATGLAITTAGNLGIGTASPAATSGRNITIDSIESSLVLKASSSRSFSIASGGNFQYANNALVFHDNTAAAIRMLIDSSGNVGIGTNTPGNIVTINDPGTGLAFSNAASGNLNIGLLAGTGSAQAYVYNRANSALLFGTNNATRASITASGEFLIGTSSQINAGLLNLAFDTGSYCAIATRPTNNAGYDAARFFNSSTTQIGSISCTTSATAYNTSSDYRLKNTIAPITGALAKVALLKPCTYKWNVNNSDGQGFIAHELAEVVPQCVTGEKDAVDAEGNPRYQGVDTSFLVATLTAAIQEQQAIITQLTARITALEGI